MTQKWALFVLQLPRQQLRSAQMTGFFALFPGGKKVRRCKPAVECRNLVSRLELVATRQRLCHAHGL